MGAIGRAARYLARKPGKAALLVLIVFVASLAAMVSVGIIGGASSMASELKAQARPSVGVYLEDGSLVPAEVADGLRARRDVSSVNRMGSVDAFPEGFRAVDAAVPDPGWDGAVRINAYDDLSQGSPFESQLIRLTEGRLFEAGDRGVALIHADLAEMNGISVGDEVTLRGAEGQEATATVIGLFSAAGGNEGEQGLTTSRTTSFNQVYAAVVFDQEGKILSMKLDQLEVATPNYDGEGMPHFAGFPGQSYNEDKDHDAVVDGTLTYDDDAFLKAVSEWQTKRERGDGYKMTTGTWRRQADKFEELFVGMTVEEVNRWFEKYCSDLNGRPLKAPGEDTKEEDKAKYEALTEDEKARLADVTAQATMSLNDSATVSPDNATD